MWHLESSYDDGRITSLQRGADGIVRGLLQSDDGRLSVIDLDRSAPDRPVVNAGFLHDFAAGPDGTVWIAGKGRLYRVDPRD